MRVRCASEFWGRTSFRTSSSDTCSVCWSCALAFRAASTCRIVRPKRPRPADPRIVCVLPVDAAHRSIRSDRTSLLWPTVDSRTAAQRKAAQTGAWFTLGAAQQICSGNQALRCAALHRIASHRALPVDSATRVNCTPLCAAQPTELTRASMAVRQHRMRPALQQTLRDRLAQLGPHRLLQPITHSKAITGLCAHCRCGPARARTK